jgi:transposase-like protein
MAQRMMTNPRKGRNNQPDPHDLGDARERRSSERSEDDRSGRAAARSSRAAEGAGTDPEVPEKAQRRQFTAEYKLRILREADTCPEGGIGALLRREGLYSSHLNTWRRQRDQGQLDGLTPKKRGRKARRRDPVAEENQRLRRENERLRRRLDQTEAIIEAQKKISEILGIRPGMPSESNECDS